MALFKELVDLFITFFKIGIVTFGGGLTMLPLLERVLINEKTGFPWMKFLITIQLHRQLRESLR